MIERLLRALEESGAEAGPEELADILWLAARIGGTAHPDPGSEQDLPDVCAEQPPPDHPALGPGGPDPVPEEEFYSAGDVTDTPGPVRQGIERVRIRRASSVRDPLAVMRALRPLGRSTDTWGGNPSDGELDEELTVRRTIEQRLPTPVLRPRRGRRLDLALVVDAHHSMLLWHDLVGELRRLFVQTGIFRDVRTWHLRGTDPASAEPLSVARTPDGERRSVQEVSDPSGHRLVLVVTDTVASGWAEADVARILRQWAAHGPVALLNVLPRRLWDRGAVRPRPMPVRSVGPASPNTSWRLGATTAGRRRSVRLRPAPEVLAIPVVEAEPTSVLHLAKLVAGSGQWTRVPCLTIPRAQPTTTASVPAPAEPSPPTRYEADDVLRRFRAGASPLAQRLAGFLSAVPLSLPVMNLVRQTLLPDAEHGHLAEVALGGLFVPWGQDAVTDPDHLSFDFRPGVREALLGGQRRDAITSVQQLVRREMGAGISEYGAASGGDFLAGRGGGVGEGSAERGLVPEAVPFAARKRVAPAPRSGPDPVERYVDHQLQGVLTRALRGHSVFALLVGEAGTGTTSAIDRAVASLPDDWTIRVPQSADELRDAANWLTPRTAVILTDLPSPLLRSDRRSTTAISELVELMDSSHPVLVLGELRPTDLGPLRTDLDLIELLDVPSPAVQAQTVRRVRDAPAHAEAVLRAALDIRRLGHPPEMSRQLLQAAAVTYMSASDERQLPLTWFSLALDYVCQSVPNGPTIMAAASRPSNHYVVGDFVEWNDRRDFPDLAPPNGLWPVLARFARLSSLDRLAQNAQARGLSDMARLLRNVDALQGRTISPLIRNLTRAVEPRVVRITPDREGSVSGLLLSSGQVLAPLAQLPAGTAPLRIESRPWRSPRTWQALLTLVAAQSPLRLLTSLDPGRTPKMPPLVTASLPSAGDWAVVVGFSWDGITQSKQVAHARYRVTTVRGDDFTLVPTASDSLPTSGSTVVDLQGRVVGMVYASRGDGGLSATRIPSFSQTTTHPRGLR
ncbi:SAV_2336 N-terminal domain-related protein [Streptomyces sp. NPDC003832]